MSTKYRLHEGVTIAAVIDHMAKPITDKQYLDAVGDDNLIYEGVSLEEIEATHLYDLDGQGEQAFMDAIVTTRNRLDRTMKAFCRELNRSMNGTGLEAKEAETGKPRKSGDLAVIASLIPLSDGQSISIVYHSPSNDPSKITAQDTLVAFRFLLNKRDVTHVVAPSNGRDISLKQTCLSLSNLAERNSAKFQAQQDANKAKEEELATLQVDTDQLTEQEAGLTAQADTLAEKVEVNTAELSRTEKLYQNQVKRNDDLREKLASLQKKPEPAPTPDPVIKGDDDKAVIPDAVKPELVTQKNRPENPGFLVPGIEVVKTTPRVIDVVYGASTVRYTWDGKGYKNKGQYLLTNGTTLDGAQLDGAGLKESQGYDAAVANALAAELKALDSKLYQKIVHDIGTISGIDDGSVKGYDRALFVSSLANALQSAAKADPAKASLAMKMIKAVQAKFAKPILSSRHKAWQLLIEDEKAGGETSTPAADEAMALLAAMQYGNKTLNDYVDVKAKAAEIIQQMKGVYDLYAHMDAAMRDAGYEFGKSDRERLMGNYLGMDEMTARDISNMKTKGILSDGKTRVVDVPDGGSMFDAGKLLRNEYSKADVLAVLAKLGGKVVQTGSINPSDEATAFLASLSDKDVMSIGGTFGPVGSMSGDKLREYLAATYPIDKLREAAAKVASDKANAPQLHWYGLRARPMSIGAQPAGSVAYIEPGQATSDPRLTELLKGRDSSVVRHGAIGFTDPLPADQVSKYELVDLSVPAWTPERRASAMAELVDVVSNMLEMDIPAIEIWNDLFKPKGSLVASNNPFYNQATDSYDSDQMVKAMQEAGYSGGVQSMALAMIQDAKDKAGTGEDLEAKAAELSAAALQSLNGFINWKKAPAGFDMEVDEEFSTVETPNGMKITVPALTLKKQGEDWEDGYVVTPEVDKETGVASGQFRVTYGEGSPISGVSTVGRWDDLISILNSKGGDKVTEPETTGNQWDESDAQVLKALQELEALRKGETDIDAYLAKMEAAFKVIEDSGALDRHEPYMHTVADRLTELMEAEGV